MKIYIVKEDYIRFLSKFDSRVAINKGEKRPYVGIVLQINDIKYYAPLTSPKPKHKKMKNQKDFRKINGGIYGAINFNNMIPVTDNEIQLLDIENETDPKYKELLKNQMRCIRQDEDNIYKTAYNLHAIFFKDEKSITSSERSIKSRCCNFRLLEKHYRNYSKECLDRILIDGDAKDHSKSVLEQLMRNQEIISTKKGMDSKRNGRYER